MDALIAVLEWLHPEESADNINTNILEPYLKRWSLFGLWPSEDKGTRSFGYFYPRCLTCVGVYGIAVFTNSLINYPHDIISWAEHVIVIMFTVMTNAKMLTFTCQASRMRGLCRDLETQHRRNVAKGDKHVKEILHQAALISRLLYLYMPSGLVSTVLCVSGVMCALAIYLRSQVFSEAIPFCDVNTSPCLELVILQESGAVCHYLLLVNICNLFFVDILSHTLAEFKILNHNLKNIRQFAVQKVAAEISKVISKRERGKVLQGRWLVLGGTRMWQRDRRKKQDEAKRLAVNRWRVKWGDRRNYDTRKRREEVERLAVNQAMEQRLAECVLHHQALLSFTADIESIFSPFLVFQIASNIMGSTFMALCITQVPTWGVKECGMILIEICIFFELFGYSWFSSQITKESSKVRDSLFGCDWLDASASFKRSMRIIMCRANERLFIRIGGSAPLSLATFRAVIKTACSYYMTMRTIATNKMN